MSPKLVCASGVDMLMDYLEGVLPADVRADVDEHVASCERCRAFVRSYGETPRIVRDATDVELSTELADSLMKFLRTKRE